MRGVCFDGSGVIAMAKCTPNRIDLCTSIIPDGAVMILRREEVLDSRESAVEGSLLLLECPNSEKDEFGTPEARKYVTSFHFSQYGVCVV